MRVIYIAGPYRGPDSWTIEQNIRRAETLALEVWKLGCVAICPHANTRFYHKALPDKVWLEGDLEILSRCDAVLVIADWQHSIGTRAELEFATLQNIPVFYGLEELNAYIHNHD
jgi:nucleoside 2-deoxyribosyltransferase